MPDLRLTVNERGEVVKVTSVDITDPLGPALLKRHTETLNTVQRDYTRGGDFQLFELIGPKWAIEDSPHLTPKEKEEALALYAALKPGDDIYQDRAVSSGGPVGDDPRTPSLKSFIIYLLDP